MIDYEEDYLSDVDGIQPGDKLYFDIDFASEAAIRAYGDINHTIVTVDDISSDNGIRIVEQFEAGHFVMKCFHRICDRRLFDDADFDAVFS